MAETDFGEFYRSYNGDTLISIYKKDGMYNIYNNKNEKIASSPSALEADEIARSKSGIDNDWVEERKMSKVNFVVNKILEGVSVREALCGVNETYEDTVDLVSLFAHYHNDKISSFSNIQKAYEILDDYIDDNNVDEPYEDTFARVPKDVQIEVLDVLNPDWRDA